MIVVIWTCGICAGRLDYYTGDKIPRNARVCDGTYLRKWDYVDLYAVIGDTFCPEYIDREPTLFEKIKMKFMTVDLKVPNPDYKSGFFRLPDLRGQFIRSNLSK